APYKEEVLGLAAEVSSLARQAGSANTLLRRRGPWRADPAAARGLVSPLRGRRIPLAGREVAVVGCGGAGRAAAAGLLRAGARGAPGHPRPARGRRHPPPPGAPL